MLRVFLIGILVALSSADQPLIFKDHWPGGYNAKFFLDPDHNYHTWCARIVFDKPVNAVEIWRAKLVTNCSNHVEFLATNEWFDLNLSAGQLYEVTLKVHTNYEQPVSGRMILNDACSRCIYSSVVLSSTQTTHVTRNIISTGQNLINKTGYFTTPSQNSHATGQNSHVPGNSTNAGQNAQMSVNNTNVALNTQVPGNKITMGQTINVYGNYLTTRRNTQVHGKIITGQTTTTPGNRLTIGQGNTIITGQATQTPGTNITKGHNTSTSTQTSTSGSSVTKSPTKYNYEQALGLSILFYDAQRSGKLPPTSPITWRGDSALSDGDNGIDLTGGWYDASDHMKFNFPMASSATNLLWGLEKWKDAYKAAGQLEMMYDMIRWPLEYFLKCWRPNQNEYYVQVGDGPTDHAYWGRPENMNMSRPAYKVTTSHPGSDVAGETAASLAAGSIVFNNKDSAFSSKLLDAAKSLYKFAKDHRGLYSKSIPQANIYYGSYKYTDELCESAAWLYKATNETQYLHDAESFYTSTQPRVLNWEDKDISCQMLLYEITKNDKYKDNVKAFVQSYMPGGTLPYTSCGLVFVNPWGSLRYAGNAAFIALLAVENGIAGDQYKAWALSQINYMLGDNNKNISYEIGFGSHYPIHPYHRSSSSSNALLKGALVGGPDQNDDYHDVQADYQKNNVACDYNAGFQSALAGLVHFAVNGQLPAAQPSTC